MKKYQVAVFGSLLKDIEFFSDEIFIIKNPKDALRQKFVASEYGAKLPIDKENLFLNFGGGCGNVSFGLNKLGIKAAPFGRIGYDQFGNELISHFKSHKIDKNLIQIDKKEPTGFSFILGVENQREHVIYTFKGATQELSFNTKYLSSFKSEYFYIAALSQKNWQNDLRKLFSKARKDKTQIIWNPGQRQLSDPKAMLELLPQTEVLIVNKDEAIQLVVEFFGKNKQLNNIKYLIYKLKTLGPTMTIITDGKIGASVLDSGGKYNKLPAYGKKVVDTVGAGDAFGSGFLAGWIHWQDAKKALQLGLKNSGSVVSKVGAQNGLLTKKNI